MAVGRRWYVTDGGITLRGNDLGRGGDIRLATLCHNFTSKGEHRRPATPDLAPANERRLTAMLTGPQNMPKFSNPPALFEAKKDIIACMKVATEARQPVVTYSDSDPPEGMAMWIIGMVARSGWHCGLGAIMSQPATMRGVPLPAGTAMRRSGIVPGPNASEI